MQEQNQVGMMKLDEFFAINRVFTLKDLESRIAANQNSFTKNSTLYNLLTYHEKQGHIRRIRRGLYHSVPKGLDPAQCPVDSFLVASKMAEDSVIAYGSALDFHGKLHSIQSRMIYLTKKRVMASFDFHDIKYQAVAIPSALKATNQETFGVQSIDRLGQSVMVTSLERTLVDVLDRPYLCGSWEEIWLSLESIEYLDMDQVVKYALFLSNSTTIAKLGFFLETHREALMIPELYFDQLHKHCPTKPHYMDRNQSEPQKMINKWNLVVPQSIINRSWEEPNADI
jgi:predicted transcriptional regulator of viral defense system